MTLGTMSYIDYHRLPLFSSGRSVLSLKKECVQKICYATPFINFYIILYVFKHIFYIHDTTNDTVLANEVLFYTLNNIEEGFFFYLQPKTIYLSNMRCIKSHCALSAVHKKVSRQTRKSKLCSTNEHFNSKLFLFFQQ